MEVSYRRDLDRNYMVVKNSRITGNEYTVRMLEQNDPPEFLKCRVRKLNGETYLYYEITSRQPVSQFYERVPMKAGDIERLLAGIRDAIMRAHQYLLDGEHILLAPQYIYMDVSSGLVQFCYLPVPREWPETEGKVGPGEETFSAEVGVAEKRVGCGDVSGKKNVTAERNSPRESREPEDEHGNRNEARDMVMELADFILKKLDHEDRRAVDLGYELFARVSQGNHDLSGTLKMILQEYGERSVRKQKKRLTEAGGAGGGSEDVDLWDDVIKNRESDALAIDRVTDVGRGGRRETTGGEATHRGAAIAGVRGGRRDAARGGATDRDQAGARAVCRDQVGIRAAGRDKTGSRVGDWDAAGGGTSGQGQAGAGAAGWDAAKGGALDQAGAGDDNGRRQGMGGGKDSHSHRTGRHRDRRKEKRKLGRGILLILAVIAGFAATVYVAELDLTQTGGLAFLLMASIWMIYSAVTRKKKKKTWMDEEDENEDEEEFLDSLIQESYVDPEETGKGWTSETDDGWENRVRDQNRPALEDDMDEATRCLTAAEYEKPLRLASLEPERYEDIRLCQEQAVIGKKKDQVDICLPFDCVSRVHARLEKRGGICYLTDLNSMNGTFVNGERLSPRETRQISIGDRISFATLRYAAEEPFGETV